MEMVTLKVFDNAMEAHLLRTKLESEGIHSFLQDENIVSLNPLYNYAVGGIKLNIQLADAERAKQIIQEIENTPILDDYDQQISCPQCGSTDLYTNFKSMKGTKGMFSAVISFLMGVFPIYYKNVYKCKNCEKEFKVDLT
ncbi:Putative signal transducing protein [Olivibacter domesticus]|uniref:Putative signal transducing protein n=2 Tax=Olivibacter domesticus TaxID=407022 RepID=A0A1H7QT93_OLID1|nr:Putative signal transducing protein [Olivibacter domesticus]